MSVRLNLVAAIAGVVFALGPAPTVAANTAGKVELAQGEVKIVRGATEFIPKVGDSIQEGDTIVTGQDAELQFETEDSGYIAVRPNTRLKIESYLAEGGDRDKSVLSLFQGTFRTVTGWIGKNMRQNYSIYTPTATIGIRGTDHEPLYIPQDAQAAEGEPGTYDKVNEGESFIRNPKGETSVKPNQAGFVPAHGRSAPQVLKQVPKFFRKTANEKVIENRREALRPHIDERRQQRQQAVQQKKQAARQKQPQEKGSAHGKAESGRRQAQGQQRQDQMAERKARQQQMQEERRQKQAERQGANRKGRHGEGRE